MAVALIVDDKLGNRALPAVNTMPNATRKQVKPAPRRDV
jgi:hypothetical protein